MDKKHRIKIYISGQITGLPIETATKLFNEAETHNILKGRYVINPMDLTHDHDKSWLNYMRHDIKELVDCDAIFMLRNWSNSKGAALELYIARELGLKIYYQEENAPTSD